MVITAESGLPSEILEQFSQERLIAAIAQDLHTNEVLMLAWMNLEALQATIASGRATYFSRSRNRLWVKGETSGNFQQVAAISYDCDGDAILLQVDQSGAACHTGERSCFYRNINLANPTYAGQAHNE
jgi:phosphoribosyl-AMP cyclohydrolase